MVNDYYEVLGVSQDATSAQIKEAFRAKAAELGRILQKGDFNEFLGAVEDATHLAKAFEALYEQKFAEENYEKDLSDLAEPGLPEEKRMEAGMRIIAAANAETLIKIFCNEGLPQALRKEAAKRIYYKHKELKSYLNSYSSSTRMIERDVLNNIGFPTGEQILAGTAHTCPFHKMLPKMASADFLSEEIRVWAGQIFLGRLDYGAKTSMELAFNSNTVARDAFMKFSEFCKEIARIRDDEAFPSQVRQQADKDLNELHRFWRAGKGQVAKADHGVGELVLKPERLRWWQVFKKHRLAKALEAKGPDKPKLAGKI